MTPMMSKYIFIRKFCMVWNLWIAKGKRRDFFVCFFLSSCRSCFSTSFLIITHRKRLNWTENKQISFRIAFITFNKHRADFSISQTFELCVCVRVNFVYVVTFSSNKKTDAEYKFCKPIRSMCLREWMFMLGKYFHEMRVCYYTWYWPKHSLFKVFKRIQMLFSKHHTVILCLRSNKFKDSLVLYF